MFVFLLGAPWAYLYYGDRSYFRFQSLTRFLAGTAFNDFANQTKSASGTQLPTPSLVQFHRKPDFPEGGFSNNVLADLAFPIPENWQSYRTASVLAPAWVNGKVITILIFISCLSSLKQANGYSLYPHLDSSNLMCCNKIMNIWIILLIKFWNCSGMCYHAF